MFSMYHVQNIVARCLIYFIKKTSNNGEKVVNFIGISKHKKRKGINPLKVWQRILDRGALTVVTCNDITATS